MVGEAEFSSETESSEDGLARKVLNLPSSSGTTISSDPETINTLGHVREMNTDGGGGEILKSALGNSEDPIWSNPSKPLSPRLVRRPRDDEALQGKTQVASALGEGRGPSQNKKEAIEEGVGDGEGLGGGDAGEGMGADDSTADGRQEAGSVASISEDMPKAITAPLDKSSNRVLEKNVPAIIGDEMGVASIIAGEGNASGEGNIDEGRGSHEGVPLPEVAREIEIAISEEVHEKLVKVAPESGTGKEKEELVTEAAPPSGSEEERDKLIEVAQKAAKMKKTKTKEREKKEGRRSRNEVDGNDEAQASVENLYSADHSSFTELSKIAVVVVDGGVQAVAQTADLTTPISPPGRRNTRSQQGNLILPKQVDKAGPKKRRRS